FGRLHGGTFMVYVGVTIVAAISLRWRWWVTLIALLAAVPPLVTVPMEIWLRRARRLTRRSRVLAAEATERGPAQAPRRAHGPARADESGWAGTAGWPGRAGWRGGRAGETGRAAGPGRLAGPARRHRGAAPGRAETRAGRRNGHQPLIAPVSTPLVKYFCTKGYTHRIGTVARKITAFCTVADGGGGLSGLVTWARAECCTTYWFSTTWMGHFSVSWI